MAVQVHLKTRYIDELCEVVVSGLYIDASTCIKILSADGRPMATATVCLIEYGHTPKLWNVFIKSWSENEGMLEALQKAGIIGEVVREVPAGYATAYECPLLKDL